MEHLTGIVDKAKSIARKLLPHHATPPIIHSEPPQPAELFHYPDVTWTVIDIPSQTGGQDYHTTGTKTTDDGDRYAVAVVADAISPPNKEAGAILAHSRKYSNDLADKLLAGTPLTEIEDTDRARLKSFALTATRITYPRKQGENYQMEVATHRDCFTAVLIPEVQDGLRLYKPKVFSLTVQGLKAAPPEVFPPGSIIFSGSDGSYYYLTEFTKSLFDNKLNQGGLSNVEEDSYQSMWDLLDDNQRKFGRLMGKEAIESDERCIKETLLLLQTIRSPAEGQETTYIDAIRNGIEGIVEQSGGFTRDDLTLLMTYLPKAQKESTIKEDKPRSLDELHEEMVSGVEVLLKDETRSPTVDGSAITGYNRSGDSSLQCRHVWYGRDTRLMNIGEAEDAMVEGVTVNLDSMYNSDNPEFIKLEGSTPPSEQRTYFIPIDPKYPVIVEHPSFIQRQSDKMPEKEIRRVLPYDFVDQELDSPVPYRRATDQDIRDAYVIYSQTIRMANTAMNLDVEEE